MARWFSKRWVWAALTGTTVALGMAAGRGEEPPKVGTTMPLNVDGKGERQFKVVKTEKQPDGTYLSELKDAKTGETLTFLTRPGDEPPKGAPSSKDTGPPKAKPRTNDPLTPSVAAMPDPPKEEKKRPILGRIFGDRDKDKTPSAMPATAGPTTANAMPAEDKKPGLFARMFGPKKPTGPSMPAATAPNIKPSSPTPPAVLPVPPGGLTGNKPPAFPAVGAPPIPVAPGGTGEPPRVMPSTKPVVPPAPAIPVPLPPSAAPSFPTPAPLPIPTAPPVTIPTPVPALPAPVPVPSVPAPPAGRGLPPIAIPPGGTSSARPIQVVVPAGYVPAQVAFDREVQPWVLSLQTMQAPSARMTAAKALAECRHCSTDGVKSVLFQAAQMDPCGEVRAACITHLCKLGYFTPHFLGYIQTACEDTDPLVRDAAKTACGKMIRK